MVGLRHAGRPKVDRFLGRCHSLQMSKTFCRLVDRKSVDQFWSGGGWFEGERKGFQWFAENIADTENESV